MRRNLFSSSALVAAITVPCVGAWAQAADSAPMQAPVQAQTQTQTQAAERAKKPVTGQAQGTEQAQSADETRAPAAVSQVRIVRLSEARGEVRLDRNTGVKFEQAFANVPIVAGERLQTLQGLAEVEFEDNSTLRLAPGTLVEFPVLGRDAGGGTVSQMRLVSGSAFLSMADGKGANVYTLGLGSRTVSLPPGSHIRVDMAGSPDGAGDRAGGPDRATVAVLGGSVTVRDGAGATLQVPKKKSATLELNSSAVPTLLAYKEAETPLDKWDKNSASYHQVRAASAFAGVSPYSYGLNDLSYYGSFANYGSCGSLWRPYLVTSSWDPYGSGVWTLYPGAGYSWVSPYPWGWTPYHTGSWQYCGGVGGGGGWGWRPGNASSWTALSNHPPTRTVHGVLHLPPALPRPGQGTLVPVNLKALPVSEPGTGGFTFRADSAGMGVPRGTFENLGKISHTVGERGIVNAPVSERQAERGMIAVARPAAPGGGARAGEGGAGAGVTRGVSGPAPAPAPQAASAGASGGGMHGSASSSSGGGSHH